MMTENQPCQPAPPVWTQWEGLVLNRPLPAKNDPSSGGQLGGQLVGVPNEVLERLRTALLLWLQWNEHYEDLVQQMYQHSTDFYRLESLADELDREREAAVGLTKQLLIELVANMASGD